MSDKRRINSFRRFIMMLMVLALVACWKTLLFLNEHAESGGKGIGKSKASSSTSSSKGMLSSNYTQHKQGLLVQDGDYRESKASPSISYSWTSSSEGKLGANVSEHKQELLEKGRDSIYMRGGPWPESTIVIKSHKLIFFATPKVACSVWKRLFRRMMGHHNWNATRMELDVHNSRINGLTYLYKFPPKQALEMMTSPDWTRAIFVRDPLSRFLSAYLDKGLKPWFMKQKCCPDTGNCVEASRSSLQGFLQVASDCSEPHWRPQNQRMAPKHWPYLNFVGHFENMEEDAKRLLEKIGAWEEYGQNGWGVDGKQPIFHVNQAPHATSAASKFRTYYNTSELIAKFESFYAKDYANPYMNLNLTRTIPL